MSELLEPIKAVADVIKNELGLSSGQIMLAYEKWDIAKNDKLYVDLSYASQRALCVKSEFDSENLQEIQSVTIHSLVQVDILSFGDEARTRKEEVLMALNSVYSKQVQEANNMQFGRIPSEWTNTSTLEETKFLNRFTMAVAVTSVKRKVKGVEYYDTFPNAEFTVNI